MKTEKIIINAFGIDKPGIVSNISGLIANSNGNILTSKMVRVETMFTIIMIISISKKNKNHLIKKINNIKDLKSFVRNIEPFNTPDNYRKYNFSIECIDNEGIIHHFTKYLNKEKINVEEMYTSLTNAPVTGSELFSLQSIVSIPKDLDISKLKLKLNSLSEENNVNYKLILKSE